jgi:hypothetical protein
MTPSLVVTMIFTLGMGWTQDLTDGLGPSVAQDIENN